METNNFYENARSSSGPLKVAKVRYAEYRVRHLEVVAVEQASSSRSTPTRLSTPSRSLARFNPFSGYFGGSSSQQQSSSFTPMKSDLDYDYLRTLKSPSCRSTRMGTRTATESSMAYPRTSPMRSSQRSPMPSRQHLLQAANAASFCKSATPGKFTYQTPTANVTLSPMTNVQRTAVSKAARSLPMTNIEKLAFYNAVESVTPLEDDYTSPPMKYFSNSRSTNATRSVTPKSPLGTCYF